MQGEVLDALRAARRAYDMHTRVLELDPQRHDAGLVAGNYRYLVSLLPWAFRVMAYLAGFDGGKAEGLSLIEGAAAYPGESQAEARFALLLMYNRERRFGEARRILHQLQSQYPRNRLLWLEEGATAATAQTSLRTLVWVDRAGREAPLALPPRAYSWPRISPDGTRVAVSIESAENRDIWVSDIDRGTLNRLTTHPAADGTPILWTPDSERIVFVSDREENQPKLFSKAADGGGEAELIGESAFAPYAWSADGQSLLVASGLPVRGRLDVGVLSMEGNGVVEPLVNSAANEGAVMSPDGQWFAPTRAARLRCTSSGFPREVTGDRSRPPGAGIPCGHPTEPDSSTAAQRMGP